MTFDFQSQTWPLRSTLTFEIKIIIPIKHKPKWISLKMSGSLLKCATPQLLILTFDLWPHSSYYQNPRLQWLCSYGRIVGLVYQHLFLSPDILLFSILLTVWHCEDMKKMPFITVHIFCLLNVKCVGISCVYYILVCVCVCVCVVRCLSWSKSHVFLPCFPS